VRATKERRIIKKWEASTHHIESLALEDRQMMMMMMMSRSRYIAHERECSSSKIKSLADAGGR
jgi:hypothetical protein